MSHIEVIALRSFPWSEDGYTPKHAEENSEPFMLPEHLFEGLNAEGYVRRAQIADGHFSLNPDREQIAALGNVATTQTVISNEVVTVQPVDEIVTVPAVTEADVTITPPTEEAAIDGTDAGDSTEPGASQKSAEKAPAVAAIGAVDATVSSPAPQPAVRTAALSDDETTSLLDGSWTAWRFFKARSVAAKLSDKPITTSDEAKAALDAEATRLQAAVVDKTETPAE